jgi:hypothetical protein
VQVDPVAATGGPEQPIGFSHKVHAGTLQLDCAFCHQVSKTGAALTMPQSATCMTCHQAIATDKPDIQRLASYAKTSELIPWIRVYQLPSFTNFSHKVHLEHGNTCQECHGKVAQRDRIFREMDISMASCVKCHTAKKASVDCSTCHTLDQ